MQTNAMKTSKADDVLHWPMSEAVINDILWVILIRKHIRIPMDYPINLPRIAPVQCCLIF